MSRCSEIEGVVIAHPRLRTCEPRVHVECQSRQESKLTHYQIMHTCCHTVTLGRFFEIFRLSYGNIQIGEKWNGKSWRPASTLPARSSARTGAKR
jgi:hypothetical protein